MAEYTVKFHTNEATTGKVFKTQVDASGSAEAAALAAKHFMREGALLSPGMMFEVAGPESVDHLRGDRLAYWLKNSGEEVAEREDLQSVIEELQAV